MHKRNTTGKEQRRLQHELQQCGEGNLLVSVAFGYDSYNQTVSREIAQTLKSNKGGDDTPRILVTVLNQETEAKPEA